MFPNVCIVYLFLFLHSACWLTRINYQTGRMIVHLCLRTSECKASSRFTGPGPLWVIVSRDYINKYTVYYLDGEKRGHQVDVPLLHCTQYKFPCNHLGKQHGVMEITNTLWLLSLQPLKRLNINNPLIRAR